MALYEKYGEFDSCEEINQAAAGQLAEGDTNAIFEIAKENGISEEDAQDYIDGINPELCTVWSAAEGKIKVEKEAMHLEELMADWATDIVRDFKENDDMEMAKAIRRKEKSLAEAFGKILKKSWAIKGKIPKEILEAAEIHGARVEMGIPGRATTAKILRKYYLEG